MGFLGSGRWEAGSAGFESRLPDGVRQPGSEPAVNVVSDAGPRVVTIRLLGLRGRSSTVELQPSKLVTRVRHPSPAPAQRGASVTHMSQQAVLT